MTRPTGITILAILQFLGAAFMVLGGILMMVGMGAAGMATGKAAGIAALAGFGAALGVVCLIFAAVNCLLGWGLWTLKNWARVVMIVLTGIGGAFGVLGMLSSLLKFQPAVLFFQLIFVGVYALIVWYLLQPHVKQAFGATGF